MIPLSRFGRFLTIRQAPAQRSRKKSGCPERKQSVPRCSPRLEQLESRVTPSTNPIILSTFELDGNATTGVLGTSGSTNTSHDWDQVFADAGSPAIHTTGTFTKGPTSQALAGTFVSDETTGDDIYTGGSTKDTLPVSGWLFKTGKPQDKDEINDAYASAYTDPSTGHLILYAGLDRFSNSGDSTAGFWFFQNQISKSTNANVGGSGAPFTGTHADGDILLVSDFSIGGSVSSISVYRWTGNDATGHLVNVTNLGNPNTFAIVNGAAVSVPWSYTDKSGFKQPQAGEFLEEGVDLTALNLQGCFSSFLAETRSSTSTTATLSDFVVGGFPLCSLAAPQFTGLSKFDTFTHQGDTVTYPLTVQNTGGMPLYIQSVSDSLLGNIVVNHTLQAPTAPVTSITSAFNFSTPLAPGASLTILVSRPVQATDPDPTPDTVTFVGTDDLAGTADPITTSVSNSVNLFQPSVSMTETASPSAGVVGTPITYTYTVTNTSSSDSPNLVLNSANQGTGDPDTFTSSLFGDIEADAVHALAGNNTATTASLAPGASFSFTETHVLAASDPTPLTDTSSAIFTLAQNLGAFPNQIHSNTTTATVRIVNAEISITGSGVNEVNNPHTFTVTVKEDLGDGNGFVTVPAGVPVTVTLSNSNGSTTSPLTYNLTTDANGQASVTFTSATAGTVTGNATTTFTIVSGNPSTTVTRSTGDSNVGDSGPVTKVFEDAQISIGPNATNGISEPHTFTVTVLENAGDGNYVAAQGVTVTVALSSPNGANPILESGSLTGTTDANGQFQVTFTSSSAGDVIGNATTTFTLNGVTLTRSTGDGKGETGFTDSGPADKTFVSGTLKWLKVDGNNNNAPLGGATFLVTATGGTAFSNSPGTALVVDNTGQAGYTGLDADPRPGYFQLNAFQNFDGTTTALTGLAMGTYTVQEITPPTGYTLDPKVLTATLTLAAPNADLTGSAFVDTRPVLTITKAASSATFVPGQTVSYTITVNNTGAGTAQNVLVTDNLPEDPNNQLAWSVTTSQFDTASISSSEVLTATSASLLGGASEAITVSALVPLSFFGSTPNGTLTDGVPPNLFELDGNTTVDTAGGHDWNQVFSDFQGTTTNASGARAVDFVNDPINTTQDNIFTGGGSKDISGIQHGPWLSTGGKPQGKDDIENAAAALYTERSTDPNPGDVILYAMVDRYDNSGDSTMGFWFFANQIGVQSGKKGSFTGSHSTGSFDSNGVFHGDILVISDFSIGGSTSTPAIYGWLGDDATGSLVQLDATTTAGKAVVVVNSGPITVPWNYVNKSGATKPDHGEFLEEGINLTSLGLSPCFTSFLAETRSSTSTSATLSDFVLGPNFETCQVTLTNTASVKADNFNNGVPITSNQVTVTITDGDGLHATSSGPGAAASSLTDAQLQPLVAQAVDYWRDAGVAPDDLHALDNVSVQLTSLAGGELGLEAPGHIWIDQTAAGWGWSVTGGQMDLASVITHEVGHALGFEHTDTGVMAATLAPGVQRLPEALSGPGSLTAAAAGSGNSSVAVGAPPTIAPAGFNLGELVVAQPTVSPLSLARTGTSEVALAAGAHDGVILPAFSGTAAVDAVLVPATRGVTSAAVFGQERAGNQVSIPLNLLAPASATLLPVVTPQAAVSVATGQDSTQILVPGLLRPGLRTESWNAAVPDNAAGEQAEVLLPADLPADALLLHWQRANDACFAGDSSVERASTAPMLPGDAAPVADSAAPVTDAVAAVAVAFALGGWWGAQPVETERRKRQRFLSRSI
jgi:uncharacterized repeat protein (TIGR01451 family)